MTADAALAPGEAQDVLAWLGVEPAPPSHASLDALLVAYGRHVPWESASRIVRRSATTEAAACVQAPRAFWAGAMRHGHGGTCFESNGAFAALLTALGWRVALTINDMPPTRGCHTALLVTLDEGETVLADAGYPLYAAVPLHVDRTGSAESDWGTYSATPIGNGRFRVEHHPRPKPDLFELIAAPVGASAYAAATAQDYGEGGLFLDRVVVRKIVDGDVWRFASSDRPWALERFRDGQCDSVPLPAGAEPAGRAVAAHFGMDADVVTRALALVAVRGQ